MKRRSSLPIVILIIALFLVVIGMSFLFRNKPAVTLPPAANIATTTEKTYINPSLHYTITYPADYAVNAAYSYRALGPNQAIPGVSFTIPAALSSGTNLSSDTYLSVEALSTSTCSALPFLGSGPSTSTQSIVDNGTRYDFAKGGGAGAGNFYDEYIYALSDTHPCIAVRYFVHSTNIGNYPPGKVKEFDKAALIRAFDAIRRSLKLNP